MATQQINLYQSEFRIEKQPLSAATLLNIITVVSAVLVLLYGFNYWQLTQARQQLVQLQQEKTAQEARLAELIRTHKPLVKSQRLAEDIKQYESWVSVRQQAINVLSEKRFGNTEGFAEYFTGLARQKINGLWITGLRFSEGGRQLGMQGSALEPELVPQLLQQLSAEDIFTGTRFDSLLMHRQDDKKQQVDFQLKSINDEGDAS